MLVSPITLNPPTIYLKIVINLNPQYIPPYSVKNFGARLLRSCPLPSLTNLPKSAFWSITPPKHNQSVPFQVVFQLILSNGQNASQWSVHMSPVDRLLRCAIFGHRAPMQTPSRTSKTCFFLKPSYCIFQTSLLNHRVLHSVN